MISQDQIDNLKSKFKKCLCGADFDPIDVADFHKTDWLWVCHAKIDGKIGPEFLGRCKISTDGERFKEWRIFWFPSLKREKKNDLEVFD